jgi:5-oxoprolinase (ATP-hydrolysing)
VKCTAFVTANGDLKIKIQQDDVDHANESTSEIVADPVKLSIFSHRFMGIAEQMGR